MTLQSHATPEVIEKTGVVSPAPDEFDPFAHWAAMLDGAVKKGNLSTGEHRSLDVVGAADSGIIKEGVA